MIKQFKIYSIGVLIGSFRSTINGLIKMSGLNPKHFKIDRMISTTEIRNGFIRQEFYDQKRSKKKSIEIYDYLMKKYNLGYDIIVKIVKSRL